MKTIGLIGGMSWESSLEYYRILNQTMKERLGGLHSADLLMYSVDFAPIEALMRSGRWDLVGDRLADIARRLEAAGAEGLLLCTNTLHTVAEAISAAVTIPLLHIADAAGARITRQGLRRVGLLGTRVTMEQPFYRQRLAERFGLEVLIPPQESERREVDRVIFEELCLGRVEPASKTRYRAIIDSLVGAGAEGIVLGCTDIAMLVPPQETHIPLFDTTRLHAEMAVEWALSDG
jgi:aspartate racemase